MFNITKRNEVIQIWLVNMLIILLLTFWFAMIQYRKGQLRWIFFAYMFFKTNYSWILLWYVLFHIQVEIGLYVMSPTLESFNRPFMRLWFYPHLFKYNLDWACGVFTEITQYLPQCIKYNESIVQLKTKMKDLGNIDCSYILCQWIV